MIKIMYQNSRKYSGKLKKKKNRKNTQKYEVDIFLELEIPFRVKQIFGPQSAMYLNVSQTKICERLKSRAVRITNTGAFTTITFVMFTVMTRYTRRYGMMFAISFVTCF